MSTPWKSKAYRIDGNTEALTTIDYEHSEIHSGSAFFAIYSALGDADDAIEMRIQTPSGNKHAHALLILESALAGTAELWTPTTKTDVIGNRITPVNRNFNSSTESTLTICHTPGGAQAGTANLTQYIGATTSGGRANASGSAGGRFEFVLESNQTYLLKLTSRVNGNALSIILDWYEHTDRSL